MRFCVFLSAVALGSLAYPAQAQSPADSLARQLRRYQQQALTEQLYVHHDRPAYAAGETMWLKVYVVDGTQHRPLAMSKVAYVELLDAARRPVLQAKLALRQALGQGTLALPAELPSGRYVLRAYTNWMKNAGPDYYFQAPISIVNTWQPVAAPTASAAPALDLRFFPEGGQLVAGVPGRLGFKATNALGRGAAVAGTVADERGTVVASFQTLRAGMGSFVFTPALGQRYTASVALPGGQKLTQPLPAAAAQGYALQLREAGPSLSVQVQARPATAETLYLVAHTGQRVTATETTAVAGGQAVFQLDARRLPPGISHLTVFAGRRPVAERLYFKRPTAGQLLAMQGQAGAAAYAPRSRATVQLQAPQPAAASLAVYRLDSLAASAAPADIAAALLLAADLPGYVEDAGYYLRDSSATARQATDNLLLTQGWRRFKWEDVLAGAPPAATYPPELNGFQLQGRLSQAGGASAPGKVAYLSLPARTFWFGNAVSEADGRVRFEVPHLYGVRKLVLQPNYATADSLLRVELLSSFTTGGGLGELGLAPAPARWATSLSERHLGVQTQRAYPAPAAQFQAVPGDTVAFYGKPDEHFFLDEYTRFPTVEDVMREYVPAVLVRKRRDGFHFVVIDRPRHINLKENPLTLLDGLPVFNINQIMAFDPLKIKRLDVMANRYFLGSQTYDGVVSYVTYKGDLGGFPLNPRALIEEYEGLQVPREFYAPRYDTDPQRQSRLPDLRNLLYWNPDLRLAANQPQTLDFFTGDQAGRYLVVVQGLGADGKPGSTSFSFEVKPAL
ncbi:hypothetical protein HHL22_12785 [Hymenobacter sp. RP-2-7]|uniref:Macroglobulin domain-containing protein n=1 Tax=Hymenobacter polaris TaxID=2682546 RepID=A0A7Y0AEZ1_9BACT|nr:hypothetical protein [Hymenobacter polaris]NML66082.1 hypothetical protein [Hymenobacter polaris]